MTTAAKPLARRHAEEHEDLRQFIMHDPLPRGKMNAMAMESMHATSPIFWVVTAVLAAIVVGRNRAARDQFAREIQGCRLGGRGAVVHGFESVAILAAIVAILATCGGCFTASPETIG